MIIIASAILVASSLMSTTIVKKATAQLIPLITITKVYEIYFWMAPGDVMFGNTDVRMWGDKKSHIIYSSGGNGAPLALVNNGVVMQGDPIQVRVDLNPHVKILHVYCAIDGLYIYRDKCSTPFEGKIYSWIKTAGISTKNLIEGNHTFSIFIDTDKGRTNTEKYGFKIDQYSSPQ